MQTETSFKSHLRSKRFTRMAIPLQQQTFIKRPQLDVSSFHLSAQLVASFFLSSRSIRSSLFTSFRFSFFRNILFKLNEILFIGLKSSRSRLNDDALESGARGAWERFWSKAANSRDLALIICTKKQIEWMHLESINVCLHREMFI